MLLKVKKKDNRIIMHHTHKILKKLNRMNSFIKIQVTVELLQEKDQQILQFLIIITALFRKNLLNALQIDKIKMTLLNRKNLKLVIILNNSKKFKIQLKKFWKILKKIF